MKHLLGEMNLMSRFVKQISKLEEKAKRAEKNLGKSLTMESVVSLVKRARVFFIVRDDLLAIFSLVNKFEKQAPEVKTILLENL